MFLKKDSVVNTVKQQRQKVMVHFFCFVAKLNKFLSSTDDTIVLHALITITTQSLGQCKEKFMIICVRR